MYICIPEAVISHLAASSTSLPNYPLTIIPLTANPNSLHSHTKRFVHRMKGRRVGRVVRGCPDSPYPACVLQASNPREGRHKGLLLTGSQTPVTHTNTHFTICRWVSPPLPRPSFPPLPLKSIAASEASKEAVNSSQASYTFYNMYPTCRRLNEHRQAHIFTKETHKKR